MYLLLRMKFAEERHELDVDEYAQAHEENAPANREPETILSTEAVFDEVCEQNQREAR